MNDKPAPLGLGLQKNKSIGIWHEIGADRRASEPWPKGVYPKEAEVEERRVAFLTKSGPGKKESGVY